MIENKLALNQTTDDTLVIIREFKAPQELVFEVLTQSKHITHWQVAGNMNIASVETDLVVGGKYRIAMQPPDKSFTFELFGEYRTINPPNKIVYTQNVPGLEQMSEITIELDQIGEETQMVFIQRDIASKQMRDNGLNGWAPVFVKLGEYIDKL